jgi:DNA-binding NarL/FixJ family response regulator
MTAATITRDATGLTRDAGRLTRDAGRRSPVGVLVGAGEAHDATVAVLLSEDIKLSRLEFVDELAGLEARRPLELVVLAGEEHGCARTQLVAQAREHAPSASIVLVCDAIESWEVRSALAGGAAGIVLVSEAGRTLAPCLTAVRSGQTCVPARNARHIERAVLSTREKQILGLVVMGYLNGQIAKRLYLAESTVKSHLTSAFGKLEVHSRNEAVDLILNPESGLALGILSLGGEPVQEIASERL